MASIKEATESTIDTLKAAVENEEGRLALIETLPERFRDITPEELAMVAAFIGKLSPQA